MALDVKVKITLSKPIGKIGFGVPLILEEFAPSTKGEDGVQNIPATPIAYTKCKELTDVVAAGFTEESKVYKAASLMLMQDNRPAEIAVCRIVEAATSFLSEALNVAKDWRQLIVVNEGVEGNVFAAPLEGAPQATTIATITSAVETMEDKLFFANPTTALTAEGMPETIERTVLFFCNPTENAPMPVAALVGETAARDAGSFTYKNLILKGIEPQSMGDVDLEAIHEMGGITFVTKAGNNVTSEGKVAGGEFIDVVDSKDWVILQIEQRIQRLLNTSDKVPYTDRGIAMLESVVVNVMKEAFNMGIIAETADGTPDYSVSFALREATTEEERVERRYPHGKFKFALAGAIHNVLVEGEITV